MEQEKREWAMVYRERLTNLWRCSWCDFTHEDFKVVADFENEEHAGKKEK